MSLLVVGSVAYDGTETPFGKRDRVPGGSATFLSLSASFFTNPVHLIGIVGKDYADKDIQRFEKRGIDLEGLQRDDSGDTFYYASKYSYDLNHRETLQTDLNVFEHFDPILTDVAKKANVVALGNIEPRLQLRVLDQVEKPKFVAMDTMNFWIEGWNEQLKETIARVDMLVVNDSEARELTGEHSLLKAADAIFAMGPKHVVIKKGEHGALLFTDGELFSAPAYPILDIYDPTGAGDAFLGGFLGWLSYTDNFSKDNMRRAVIFGSVMASFAVEEFGPERLDSLTNDEVQERYYEFQALSQIPDPHHS